MKLSPKVLAVSVDSFGDKGGWRPQTASAEYDGCLRKSRLAAGMPLETESPQGVTHGRSQYGH